MVASKSLPTILDVELSPEHEAELLLYGVSSTEAKLAIKDGSREQVRQTGHAYCQGWLKDARRIIATGRILDGVLWVWYLDVLGAET